MWTQAQRERLAWEHRVLQEAGLTQFTLYHASASDSYYVTGTTQTNAGHAFQLWSPIPAGFPNRRPALYVISPKVLSTATGRSINALGLSHDMHTLEAHQDGFVQICHWRDDRWVRTMGGRG